MQNSAGASPQVIFIFCPRLFDIRYLVSTGIVRLLEARTKVVLFVPKRYSTIVRHNVGDAVEVRELAASEEQFEGREECEWPTWLRNRICRYLGSILGLVYDCKKRKNSSQKLHIRSLLAKRKRNKIIQRISAYLMVWLAGFASYSKATRLILQKLFYWVSPKDRHRDAYRKFKPALVLTCTFGLGSDGIIMAEAGRNRVRTVTAVQSWDKISTKGYPTVFPNAAILWSEFSAGEAEAFLNMPRKSLHVEGAPLWDKHFSGVRKRDRLTFLRAYGLDPETRLIAVSIGSPCYHQGNLRLIDFLIDQASTGKLKPPVSLIFRQHPGYLSYASERSEMLEFIKNKLACRNVAFMDVELREHGGELMYREADSESLCELLTHCDLSISIVSSHLIEAAIFDKPAINIEYGQWTNDMYDFDLSQYTAEHLYRIYRTKAVYRARNENELIDMANEAMAYPEKMHDARRLLVLQEAPVNQGDAAIHVAEKIVCLAQTSDKGMKEQDKLQRICLGTLIHRASERWRGIRVAFIHWWHRKKHVQMYGEIDNIVLRYRQGGGLNHSYQKYKLFELSRLLRELKPRRILELGTGTSSAVIANYVRSVPGARLTMIDQSSEWLEHSRSLAAITPNDSRFELVVSSVVENGSSKPPTVSYGVQLAEQFDLVVVDGPSLIIDGHKNKLAVNSNIVDLVSQNPPAAILIDIRKATVDLLTEQFGHLYDIRTSDVLGCRERFGYTYFTEMRFLTAPVEHS